MASRIGLMALLIAAVANTVPGMTVAAPQPVEAPRPDAVVDIDAVVAKAFARLADTGPSSMADVLAPLDRESRMISLLRKMQPAWPAVSSDPAKVRVELVRREAVGRSMVRYLYLLVLPKQPILWTVTMARPDGETWQLWTLKVSDRLQDNREVFRDAAAEGDFEVPCRVAAAFWEALAAGEDAMPIIEPHIGALPEESAASDQFRRMLASISGIGRRADKRVELARCEPLSPSLIRIVYVEHAPNILGAAEMVFYRPADRWFVVTFNYQFGNDHVFELLFPDSPGNPDPAVSQSADVPRR